MVKAESAARRARPRSAFALLSALLIALVIGAGCAAAPPLGLPTPRLLASSVAGRCEGDILAVGERIFFLQSAVERAPLWMSLGRAGDASPQLDQGPDRLQVPLEARASDQAALYFVGASAEDGARAAWRWRASADAPERLLPLEGDDLLGLWALPGEGQGAGLIRRGADGAQRLWHLTSGAPASLALTLPAGAAWGEQAQRSGPRWFVTARGEGDGEELWSALEGEAAARVVDARPGPESAEVFAPTPLGDGRLLLSLDDGVHGHEPWISDGTAAGTRPLADLMPGSEPSWPSLATQWRGDWYLFATHPAHGRALWRLDADGQGLSLVTPLCWAKPRDESGEEPDEAGDDAPREEPRCDLNPYALTASADGLLFLAVGAVYSADMPYAGSTCFTLWRFDGHAAQSLSASGCAGGPTDGVQQLVVRGHRACFHDQEALRCVDLSADPNAPSASVEVASIDDISDLLHAPTLITSDAAYVCSADQNGLWRLGFDMSPQSAARPAPVRLNASLPAAAPILSGYTNRQGENAPQAVGGFTYFTTRDGLWRTDHTLAGTQPTSVAGSNVRAAAARGGKLLLSYDGLSAPLVSKRGVGAFDTATQTYTHLINGLYGAQILAQDDEAIFFRSAYIGILEASSASPEVGLWRTDLTPTGTRLWLDPAQWQQAVKDYSLFDRPNAARWLNGRLIFLLSQPYVPASADGSPIARPTSADVKERLSLRIAAPGDPLPTQTELVALASGRASISDTLYSWLLIGDGALTRIQSDAFGVEPWFTDGTPEGTRLVKDIMPGPVGSGMEDFMGWGDLALFTADDGAHGPALWISDGTTDGTRLIADLRADDKDPKLDCVTSTSLGVFFQADDGVHGQEPWFTDGTPEGTFLIADLEPGPEGSGACGFILGAHRLYFTASTLAAGVALWTQPADRSQPPTPWLTMPALHADARDWRWCDVVTAAEGLLLSTCADGVALPDGEEAESDRDLWFLPSPHDFPPAEPQ